jgi:hypothetical protein
VEGSPTGRATASGDGRSSDAAKNQEQTAKLKLKNVIPMRKAMRNL